jgi:hypothetical protein
MRLLLDTGAVLWFLGNDPYLSAAAHTASQGDEDRDRPSSLPDRAALPGSGVNLEEETQESMTAEATGTVEKGALKLDQALPFPDHTRVKLTIEAVEPEQSSAAAWKRLKEHIRQHPIHGLSRMFTREDLYERD